MPPADEQGHRPPAAIRNQAARPPGSVERLSGGDATTNWWALGPDGGQVVAADHSPTADGVALAATFAGIYRSTDGGDSWQLIPETSSLWCNDLEFAPDGTAYAGPLDGLWASTDDGASWVRQDIGFSAQVREVAIDPANPNNLWAGLDNVGDSSILIVRSTDGGDSWSPATPTLPSGFSCLGIAVDPSDSDQVVAAFSGFPGGGQVWFSGDAGATWVNRSSGLPSNPMNVVAHDGSRVLVGGGRRFNSGFVGLYASSDGGVSWQPLHDDSWPLLVVNDLELDPADPNLLLAATAGTGVHRSVDGGASWQLSVGGTAELAALSVRFVSGASNRSPTRVGGASFGSTDVILLGTASKGVFRSTTGGDEFEPATDGINLLDVNSIVANPVNGRELAAAFEGENTGGVYTSTNGGLGWTLEELPPTRYRTVRFAPDGTLYAISSGPSSIAPEGLYRREANGTWTALGPDQGGLFETHLDALRFSVNDPDLILAGGNDFGVAGFEPTVWRSTDAGQSWSKVYEGFGSSSSVSDLEIVEDGTDTDMLASYFFGDLGGVLRSTDGGVSWATSNTGLPEAPGTFYGSSLCAPTGSVDAFYLADQAAGRLWRSTDRGLSWQVAGVTGNPLEEVVCDPAADNVLYVAQLFSQEEVLRSDDGGATFEGFDPGLDGSRALRGLDISSEPVPRLLLATNRGAYARYLAPGVVFADGFEAGDTSAWTETVP